MPLQSRLNLSLYTFVAPDLIVPYGDVTDSLEFASVSPGGCGDLTATIKLKNARLPRPEFALYSRIALMEGPDCLWQGEVTDPELGMNEQDGEYVSIKGLGLGASLKDDPASFVYSGQTAQQIVINQLAAGNRPNYLPLDQDTSGIFPDNPAATFSPVYPDTNMEEVIADIATLAGDYAWGVWPHKVNRDIAGFPTGQLLVHLRDTSTVAYTAIPELGDVIGWRIMPSGERAYNVVTVGFYDAAQNPPVGYSSYIDPRLAANGSQGTAPFRRRKYLNNLSGIQTVTKAQALAIATVYGGEFQNVTNRVEITLRSVRDANRQPINLWRVLADRNILITGIVDRAPTPSLPLTAAAGVNLFYIVEARYTEDASGTQQLVLQCDNWVDTAQIQIARLQLKQDTLNRKGVKTAVSVGALGAQQISPWSVRFSNGAAASFEGNAVDFDVVLTQAPTSLSFSTTSSANTTGPNVQNIDTYGAHAYATVAANGAGFMIGKFTTVGACLRDVDVARGTFTHHCDGCNVVRKGLSAPRDLIVDQTFGTDPGISTLRFDCPLCGSTHPQRQGAMSECFNTNLGPEDEDETAPNNYPFRAEQARLIRALHPLLGLTRRETPLPPNTPDTPAA